MLRDTPLATLYIKAYAMLSGVTNDKRSDDLLQLKQYLYKVWIRIPCIDTHVADTILNMTRLFPMHRRFVTPLVATVCLGLTSYCVYIVRSNKQI